jgi:hypothetical protein
VDHSLEAGRIAKQVEKLIGKTVKEDAQRKEKDD